MRLWLNHTEEVSLREQLATQVKLGILCREIAPGERLPSTRELARRYGIHANTANTASAAYQQLVQEGWIEPRHGSGVYAKASLPPAPQSPRMATEYALDQLIGELMAKARKLGASELMVRERLHRWMSLTPPSRWLVIDPEPELRSILIHEMRQALRLPIEECTPDEAGQPGRIEGGMPVTVPSKAALVRALLPAGTELTVLAVHPVSLELMVHLQRYLPDHAGELVGIPAGTYIALHPDGTPDLVQMPHDTPILGLICMGGSWLGPGEGAVVASYPSGKLKLCYLAGDQQVQGVPCAHGGFFASLGGVDPGLLFDESGKLRACKLAKVYGAQRKGEHFAQSR